MPSQPKPIGEIIGNLTYGYRHKETLPTPLKATDIVDIARVSPQAGVSAKDLLNRILVEGRGDAGVNGYNTNNPRANARYEQGKAQGASDTAAQFLAAVLDKSETAKRTGRSFDEVWNGVGRSADTGKTGADYAARMKQMQGAASDPRNAPLLDLVQRAQEGKITPQERLSLDKPEVILGRIYGNVKDNYYDLFDSDTSPLAGSIRQKYKEAGTSAKQEDLKWTSTAQDKLLAYIRKEAGATLTYEDRNALSWDKPGSVSEKVFTQLAREALPSLGINKKAE